MKDAVEAFAAAKFDQDFLRDMKREVARARQKFPSQSVLITLAALTEEVGELAQAVLQYNFEREAKHATAEKIYKEAVQTAVMAMRVALDCDLEGMQ